MSRGQNTIKRSEVSTTPILLKYSASYDSASFSANGITVNRGVNSSYDRDGVQFLNYALVRQLYYQEYVTGSLLLSSSYWDSSIQSTAASGTFDNDYRYFPTASSAQLTVIGIPRTAFGEQVARKSLCITGSTYKLIDDGNGNVIDSKNSNVHVGNILYSQGVMVLTNEDYKFAMIPPRPSTIYWSNTQQGTPYIDSDLYADTVDGSTLLAAITENGSFVQTAGLSLIVKQNSGDTTGYTGYFRLTIKNITDDITIYSNLHTEVVSVYSTVNNYTFLVEPDKSYSIDAIAYS